MATPPPHSDEVIEIASSPEPESPTGLSPLNSNSTPPLSVLGKRSQTHQSPSAGPPPSKRRPPPGAMRYPHGVTCMNYIAGEDPTNTLRFSDLVGPTTLQKAVLTSFVVDRQWLKAQLPAGISLCLVEHWNPSQGECQGVARVDAHTILVHPPMPHTNFGCFHAKLMLLYYPGFLRVVVNSANLIPLDWDVMDNVIFCQDFPTIGASPASVQPPPAHVPEFGQTLHRFLEHCAVPTQVRSSLQQYNFSAARTQMAHIIAQHYPPPSSGSNADATRDLSQPRFNIEFQRGRVPYDPGYRVNHDFQLLEYFSAVYPSLETVKDSLYGPNGATSLFLNEKMYSSLEYKPCFKDCISRRPGRLMHSKVITARSTAATADGADPAYAWFYIGSHNLSPSAWGTVIQPRRAQGRPLGADGQPLPQLHIRNYELGVIQFTDHVPSDTALHLAQNAHWQPPFLSPAPAYMTTDEPWMAEKHLPAT
ncbi:hypothetical protein H4R34_002623 [Dimargaris verticillata]|uniref:Tyrosyl-DNA phosphodiesterase I n=1 Tax=Dimargaris verticillata TaxID=2761393 RepID=A0A9W8E9T7_9FUNG|nr:hypothetical protein H4R34_002623 [Dimargaris verticillata]